MAKRRSRAKAETPAEETTAPISEEATEALDSLPSPHELAQEPAPYQHPATEPVPAPPVESPPAEQHANGHQEPAKKPWKDRFVGVLDVLPGVKVKGIDNGNKAGLGIKLDYDDPSQRPSKAVTQILREGGHYFDNGAKAWRRQIMSREEKDRLNALPKDSPEAQALDAEIRERAGHMRDEQARTHVEVVEQICKEQAEHAR